MLSQALRIPDAEAAGYIVRRPYDRGGFNTEGYTSQQELLGDIETIWLTTLKEELGIQKTELKVYSSCLPPSNLAKQLTLNPQYRTTRPSFSSPTSTTTSMYAR